ncbi:hypothetical protein ABTZ03_14120 [Kitasatospora sp. NPDC096077]|uniref:hypothetical protein n=1 Tax=Kitasatospora sp. NPDC096077 TaxID=3155544 RepID=UPI003323E56C
MILAVDVHSHAYQLGQYVAEWGIPALIVVVIGWSLTRSWRNPVARTLEEAPRVSALHRRRTTLSVLATVLVACALVTALAVEVGTDSDYGPAGASGPTGRTVDAPETVAGYHLITGADADALAARMPGSTPERYWFYGDSPDADRPSVLLTASTAQWDPKLAHEMATHSLSWGLYNFFAGARIEDARTVDAGPLGGEMQCGTRTGKVTAVLCRWGDASTVGTVAVYDTTDIDRAGAIAVRFRTETEH